MHMLGPSVALYWPGTHAVHAPSFSVAPSSVSGRDEGETKPWPRGQPDVAMRWHKPKTS
jgi:hypothetical protein